MTLHAITRQRHDLRSRLLTVSHVQRLTPAMVRVVLTGDLEGFASAGYDDHVKVFFPHPGEDAPVMPQIQDGKVAYPEGVVRPALRDFTPRSYDSQAGELTIDFAIHAVGPASDWAAQAQPGQKLGIAGPRGSFVVTDDFDWYLLVGDETALPAIGRRLEELRPAARAIVIAAVANPYERQTFESLAQVDVRWVYRPLSEAVDPAHLLNAVAAIGLPPGDGYAWVACESGTAKAIREHLVNTAGLNKTWVKASGYWRPGDAAVHDSLGD